MVIAAILVIDDAVERARSVSAEYVGVRSEPVIPPFEVITTVASSEAGADGDYSLESTLDHIRPWERPPVLDFASGGVRFALGGANPT